MTKLVPLKCPICGANVPRETLTCEYCGTSFILSKGKSTLEPVEPKVRITEEDVEEAGIAFYETIGLTADEDEEEHKLYELRADGKIDEQTFKRLKKQLKETYKKISDIRAETDSRTNEERVKLRKLFNSGEIDEETYKQSREQLNEEYNRLKKQLKEEYDKLVAGYLPPPPPPSPPRKFWKRFRT